MAQLLFSFCTETLQSWQQYEQCTGINTRKNNNGLKARHIQHLHEQVTPLPYWCRGNESQRYQQYLGELLHWVHANHTYGVRKWSIIVTNSQIHQSALYRCAVVSPVCVMMCRGNMLGDKDFVMYCSILLHVTCFHFFISLSHVQLKILKFTLNFNLHLRWRNSKWQ
jgi:hypothetical protein